MDGGDEWENGATDRIREPNSNVVAYLITFRCYGTWLHGDERGSVDWKQNVFATPMRDPSSARQRAMSIRMKSSAASLDPDRRRIVEATVREVCERRDWRLHAINVRTEHVHVLVTAPPPPEKVMNDLKAWCTRRLREPGVVGADERVWSKHGSTRYVWSEEQFGRAWEYVVHGQG